MLKREWQRRRQAESLNQWRERKDREVQQRRERLTVQRLFVVALIVAALFGMVAARTADAATPSEENIVAVIVARLPIPDSELARAAAAQTLLNVIDATEADAATAALAAIDLAENEYRHDGGEAFIRRLDQAHATIDAIQSEDSPRHYLIVPVTCAQGTRLLFPKPDEFGPDFSIRLASIEGACQIGNMGVVP